jgi:hypothetical protein
MAVLRRGALALAAFAPAAEGIGGNGRAYYKAVAASL